MTDQKQCPTCHVTKPLTGFYTDPKNKKTGGVQHQCKECQRAESRARGRAMKRLRENHPDEYADYLEQEKQ